MRGGTKFKLDESVVYTDGSYPVGLCCGVVRASYRSTRCDAPRPRVPREIEHMTGRRSKQEVYRDEIIGQLRETLAICREQMKDKQVALPERQRWAQSLTNAAQVLNTVLRDEQFHEWEKKIRILEKQGLLDTTDLVGSEP